MITACHQFEVEELKPDLTPLLDIIFIVMVFLMLTANVAVHTLNVAIPQTEDGQVLEQPTQQVISVGILASNIPWALDGKTYANWEEFTTQLLQLTEHFPNKPLVIATDKSTPVEAMLRLLAFLQKNQITATNIVMEETQL